MFSLSLVKEAHEFGYPTTTTSTTAATSESTLSPKVWFLGLVSNEIYGLGSNNKNLFSSILKNSTTQVIYTSPIAEKMFQSVFAILYDSRTEEWTIAIRGSVALEDYLINALASPHFLSSDETPKDTEPEDAYVHTGGYKTASDLFMYLQSDEVLRKCFWEKVGSHSVINVCGHSLGGATATVLTLLLQSRLLKNAHSFAFAPIPVLSPALAEHWSRQHVTTVVFGLDIAPRLSIVNLVRFSF